MLGLAVERSATHKVCDTCDGGMISWQYASHHMLPIQSSEEPRSACSILGARCRNSMADLQSSCDCDVGPRNGRTINENSSPYRPLLPTYQSGISGTLMIYTDEASLA